MHGTETCGASGDRECVGYGMEHECCPGADASMPCEERNPCP